MSYSFDAIEGRYQSFHSEPCSLEKQIQMSQFGVGSAAIRLSFLDFSCNNITSHISTDTNYDGSIFCINIGNEIRIYSQENNNSSTERRFCSGSPAHIRFRSTLTSHCFRQMTDKVKDTQLLIGLANGEIKLIDPLKEDPNKVFNEAKSIDETSVTCISWVPHSPHQFLVSHSSGCMYLYDETLAQLSTPTYNLFKQGIGFSVYTCKTKSTRNPLYRWTLGSSNNNNNTSKFDNSKSISKHTDYINGYIQNKMYETRNTNSFNYDSSSMINSLFDDNNVSINHFAFSPCGRFLAIVTEDGYMRVMEYHEMELYGFMRSYFGGLLCVDWSPDSLFIVTGGQDDLITIWSVLHRAVICRGQGHKSWVSMVRFDPYLCPNTDMPPPSSSSLSSSVCINHEELTENSMIIRNSPVTLCDNGDLRSYRLGSVAHDTMLCLWELTDDIIRQGVEFIQSSTIMKKHLHNLNYNTTCYSHGKNSSCLQNSFNEIFTSYSNNIISNCNISPIVTDTIVTVLSSNNNNDSITSTIIPSSYIHSTTTTTTTTTNRFSMKLLNDNRYINNKRKNTLMNNSTSSSLPAAPTSVSSTSSSSSSSSSSASSGPPLNNESMDKCNKSIFSISRGFHFAYTNSSNRIVRFPRIGMNNSITIGSASGGGGGGGGTDKLNTSTMNSIKTCSLNRLNEVKWMLSVSENNIFGSPLCPRINDVPMLEPLVCTRILKDRVTDLVFRRDTIHIVDQQGLFLAWQRPMEVKENNGPSFRIPVCQQSSE
ncbi:unnamed protein product [Heterobilharzia americana]|nr:unnamed protein product [Heterobilharzia americana]